MNYKDKEKEYYKNVRIDVLTLLPKNSKDLKILEVGAGYGATLSYLKEKNIAKEVVGIDIPSNKGTCPFNNIDAFIYEDIEKLELNQYISSFDYIILADVLEHLVNPENVLVKLKPLLTEEGNLLVSMPNFRHKKALYKVFIKGDFSYEESGLFDYTHLRFFCKKNIINLVETNGYKVLKTVSSLKIYNKSSLSKLINTITFGLFEQFLTVQYLIRASKK